MAFYGKVVSSTAAILNTAWPPCGTQVDCVFPTGQKARREAGSTLCLPVLEAIEDEIPTFTVLGSVYL